MRETWLMQSLREASEQAALLPRWAVEITRAWDAQYAPWRSTPSRPEGDPR